MAGWEGRWHWVRAGEKIATINMLAEADRLHLGYRSRVPDDDWKEVVEVVRIDRARCRFGGTRPYFICPSIANGNPCCRRIAKLYGLRGGFSCRHCHDLAYASQSQSEWERAYRRANKIRRRLGGDIGPGAQFPRRPKSMWWRTYERLRDRAVDAEMRAREDLVHQANCLL